MKTVKKYCEDKADKAESKMLSSSELNFSK